MKKATTATVTKPTGPYANQMVPDPTFRDLMTAYYKTQTLCAFARQWVEANPRDPRRKRVQKAISDFYDMRDRLLLIELKEQFPTGRMYGEQD